MNSELRQDLVSGDWMVIAPKRAKRPHQFVEKQKRKKEPISGCPFENPQKSGHKESIFVYKGKNNWEIQIIENKYPAFAHKKTCPAIIKSGPYSLIEAVGHHDLLITRNHYKNFPKLNLKEVFSVFKALSEHYKYLAKDKCVAYVSMFHNWGVKAGASIFHPHYQVISIPVIPQDVSHSLDGSLKYFRKTKKCAHCVMIGWEKNRKTRIIYENKGAIVFSPFASKEPFEVRIFPKKHLSCFEDSADVDLKYVSEALRTALMKIEKKLKDPDYNFFIHTAPIFNKNKYHYYHWHIEIQPKISISAGFELGTGIEITPVDPDEAAKILR